MANGHQERRRTCFECPYAYSRDDTGAWGCHLFGEECAGNKQFDDDICYVHPKRLQHMAYRWNKRSISYEKECWKYRSEYRKPVTDKTFVQKPYVLGYSVLGGPFPYGYGDYSKVYRPDMKGGHHHRRNYCICSQCGHWFRRNRGIHDYEFSDGPLHFCNRTCDEQAQWEAYLEADVGGKYEAHYWDAAEDEEWKRKREERR